MKLRNESLLQGILTTLRILEHQLKQQHINHLAIEWRYLIALIQSAYLAVSEGEGIDKKALVKTMRGITHKIDHEVVNIEAELQGVQNYASLSEDKLAEIKLKQELKKELQKIIQLITESPILTKHADLSDVVEMLRK